MNDTSQQFDPGSAPVIVAAGPGDPDRMQQGAGPEATEHDDLETAQDDGLLARIEAQLPQGYQLDPEVRLIKRYSAREGTRLPAQLQYPCYKFAVDIFR